METKGVRKYVKMGAQILWFPIALCFFVIFSLFAAVGILGLAIPLWDCYELKFKRYKDSFLLGITPKPKDIDINPRS